MPLYKNGSLVGGIGVVMGSTLDLNPFQQATREELIAVAGSRS
jgi:hypothetical protein